MFIAHIALFACKIWMLSTGLTDVMKSISMVVDAVEEGVDEPMLGTIRQESRRKRRAGYTVVLLILPFQILF